MTAPQFVVYAGHKPFRTACDTLLRAAGARVRMASRQAELAKAIAGGATVVIIAGDAPSDVAAARMLAVTSAAAVLVVQRAPGESIENIVARALAVASTLLVDQPRSSK